MAPPNVVVVLTDQLRASALGCYGNRQVSTPTLDGLADDGLRFENAYSPHPVCTPARGSLQTGLAKFEHRAIRNWAPVDARADRPTLARSFREAGYRTGYVGKWHLDGQTGSGATHGGDGGDGSGFVPPGPRRLGYEFWSGFNTGHRHHEGHPRFTRDGEVYRERDDEWQPTVQTDLARDFFARNREEPFLLFLSWGPPHPPFEAPEGYDYDPDALDLPPNVPDELRPEARENLAEYYGMIEALDDDMGRLLDGLDDAGVAEETVVVFTADHGETLGSHGQPRGKNLPYEEAANVPLIVRYPDGVDAGRESSGLLSLVDLYPTLAGLCGVPVPDVAGRDRSAHVRGEAPAPEEPVYVESGWRAVRTGRYTMRVDDGLEPAELYDVEADPYQQENLVGEADPELLADLLSRLIEQAYRFGDYEVAGDAFRRGSPWGPEIDDGIEAHLDVDYERYGRR